jgi:hypothetical protein
VSREPPDAAAAGDSGATAETRPNQWRGQISSVDLLGDRVRVRVSGAAGDAPDITAEVLPAAVDKLKLDDGGDLWVSVDPAAITVYLA